MNPIHLTEGKSQANAYPAASRTKGLFVGFNAKYLPGGRAVLAGIRRFHPDVKRYAMVPAEEVTTVRAALGDLAEVLPPPRPVRFVPERCQPGVYKVFAACVPVDVVLYLDADVCVCRPLPEAWEVPPGQVNVVRDVATTVLDNLAADLKATYAAQFPKIAAVKGFNGGMFALARRDWPDLPERFEAVLEQGNYAHYPAILDQPILNALMYDRANWLPAAFNAQHFFLQDPIPRDARVFHFLSSSKPWMPTFPKHEPSYYYWQRYGMMNENALYLFWLWLNSQVQMPARALLRKLRSLGQKHS
jgi:Glycosyl transferase family 8